MEYTDGKFKCPDFEVKFEIEQLIRNQSLGKHDGEQIEYAYEKYLKEKGVKDFKVEINDEYRNRIF